MASDERRPYIPGEYRAGIPRRRRASEEVWRLYYDGRVQSCELRDDSADGAGWDVMMLDAAGHRPHDCETTRQAAAALRGTQPAARVDVPELPEVDPARRAPRPLPPIVQVAPSVRPETRPRRRPSEHAPRLAANSCETCGNLMASVNGDWVCLHCGA